MSYRERYICTNTCEGKFDGEILEREIFDDGKPAKRESFDRGLGKVLWLIRGELLKDSKIIAKVLEFFVVKINFEI